MKKSYFKIKIPVHEFSLEMLLSTAEGLPGLMTNVGRMLSSHRAICPISLLDSHYALCNLSLSLME